MSPGLTNKSLESSSLPSLDLGTPINSTFKGSNGQSMPKGKQWSLPAGAYTPREIVEANAPLLEVVLHHLGPNLEDGRPPREMLLDNLASNLALDTRESSISIPQREAGSIEMAEQAVKVGKTLIQYANEVTDVEYDPDYVVRSPCEGHLLKPKVAALMFGPRSLRHLMQVYNEYLHQMVLLRDALLPFENYEDVVVPITEEPGRKRGIRPTEEARSAFLMELGTKSITQASVVKYALALLAPKLSNENVYGFQYQYGTVLPSFITGSRSFRLLRYFPSRVDESASEVVFQNELVDYYTAERSPISDAGNHTPEQQKASVQASLVSTEAGTPTARHLYLALYQDTEHPIKVDVGQIARGRRYAYTVNNEEASPVDRDDTPVRVHSAWEVLTKSGTGLLEATKGVHLIRANTNAELLALLGKLYPENVVVIKKGQSLEKAKVAGKALPDAGKFIIEYLGEEESVVPNL